MTRSSSLGVAALLCYLPHAIWHIAHGHPWDLLWMCDVAMPVLVIGCFARKARAVVTAFLFLVYGTPMWLLDLAAGGNMVLTSPLIHLGGLGVAFLSVRELGWPPRSWIVASLAAAGVLGVTRLISPRDANVNMAFRVYEGWTHFFSNHTLYLAGLWLTATLLFWSMERWGRGRAVLSRSTARDLR